VAEVSADDRTDGFGCSFFTRLIACAREA
jgi:hypothetical protein